MTPLPLPIRAPAYVAALLLALVASAVPVAAAAVPMTFTVNSPADVPDATPGNGVCETVTGNQVCTLRGAIQEANAHAGADTINLQANATYLLSRVGIDDTALNGDLDVTDNVTIVGAGPTTVIDGNGAVTGERVLQVVHCLGNAPPDMDGNCAGNAVVVVDISGVTFQHGQASQFGGGIFNAGDLTLDNCIVTNNTVNLLNDQGGGIYNAGALMLSHSVVSNNTTGSHNALGGGIYTQAQTTIVDSTISDNSTFAAISSPGVGGGIRAIGSNFTPPFVVLIRNSTISGNHAEQGGGMNIFNTTVVLINTTVSGNLSNGAGGGIYVGAGTTGLYNATVAFNQANADSSGSATGGGVSNAGGTLNLDNSIISGNEVIVVNKTGGVLLDFDECAGTLTSLGNNLLTNVNTAHCTINGPHTLTDVAMGPLQDNGGPTRTHALLPGSDAIDAGNIAGCTDNDGAPIGTDQRGVHRPNGAFCDVGAFELEEVIFQDGFEP